MKIQLSEKIRELRRRSGKTQEALAAALGVSTQAVSRWEASGGYPDMECIPSIANYFGVSIDELFGYHGERDKKVDALLARADELDSQNLRDDATIDECLTLLREGLAEFPGNEKITYRLACVLSEAGWHRHNEWVHYGDDGYIRYDFDVRQTNAYWSEATRLFETLASSAQEGAIRTDAVCHLIPLYRNVGRFDKATALAATLPSIESCREIMLAGASDGKTQASYLADALLKLAYQFAENLVYALVNCRTHFESDMPIQKIKGCIALFDLICDDGNLGIYHREVAYLYLYLSRLQWERGYHDEAFVSLDHALAHARSYDKLSLAENPSYTAPLVASASCEVCDFVEHGTMASHLSEDFPMWCNPDYRAVKAEMCADPRWDEWVRKTKQA